MNPLPFDSPALAELQASPEMRRLTLVLSLLVGCFARLSGAQQPNAVALMRTSLRAEPATTAAVVATIPPKSEVTQGTCAHGWCAVTIGAKSGYVLQQLLVAAPPTPLAARAYTNSDGMRVKAPQRSANAQVPTGASAQCRDGTYSFSLHRQGTCSHHGGVAQWLP